MPVGVSKSPDSAAGRAWSTDSEESLALDIALRPGCPQFQSSSQITPPIPLGSGYQVV